VRATLGQPGAPLGADVRGAMEQRFGVDFSRIRVHDDTQAAASAQQIGSHAYTVGNHVAFARGMYQPGSPAGARLLAHELVHTIQQSGAEPPQAGLTMGSPGDAYEREADALADAASATPGAASLEARPSARSPAVQRDDGDKPAKKPLIPIPVFDELDPMVTVPDVKGVPDFMKGQTVKLSDVQKAIDIFSGKSDSGLDCAPGIGFERMKSGPFKGKCCTGTMRDEAHCCILSRIDQIQNRCCRPTEAGIQGRCVELPPAKPPSLPGPGPKQDKPPPVVPPPQLAIPVDVSVHFLYDRPGGSATAPGAGGGKATKPAGDDSVLAPDGAAALDRLAGQLKDNPSFRVQLTGKASSEGPVNYNMDLGARRARYVAAALAARGIDRTRITAPPGAEKSPGCTDVDPGIVSCGETGASKEVDPADRQVYARVFRVP